MSILDGIEDKRNFPVPEGSEFILDGPDYWGDDRVIKSLDDLFEVLNLIEPETLANHVDENRNDFAQWVEDVFGEKELAEQLRLPPTPLRMMITIEKFLR